MRFGATQKQTELLRDMTEEMSNAGLREPLARTSPMPGGFLDVDHIAVVDRAGKVRRYFEGMRASTPAAIVKFLDDLRTEKKSP